MYNNLFVTTVHYVEVDAELDYIEKTLNLRTVAKVKGKFAMSAENIKRIIENKKIDINSLIFKLCSVDDEEKTIFSTDDVFKKVHTIDELFFHIMQYCSIYDYDLLIAFVESTNCNEAKEELERFTKQLHSSILRDLNLLCMEELQDHRGFMHGTHKLVIKYVGGNKCTVKTQELVKNIIYERYHLQMGSIIFKGVEEGCVAFIYQISPAVKAHFLQYPLASFSENDNIQNITIDDKVIQLQGNFCVSVCVYVYMHLYT